MLGIQIMTTRSTRKSKDKIFSAFIAYYFFKVGFYSIAQAILEFQVFQP